MENIYTAVKTRSGRPGWSVIFSHPLRRDARGKLGLKIRRGLDTTDDQRADELVGQLNQLLSDRKWWSPDRRADALALNFDSKVVSAFFDGIEVGRIDTMQLREAKIPLPGRELGYARVLFVGTIGAGKTTLLRQIIGSSHERDSFPATSAGRTTTADTEIIISEGAFEAVVTFMSEHQVLARIEECVEAACLCAIEGGSDQKVAAALLMDREQRFRLFHIIGDLDLDDVHDEEEDFSFSSIAPTSSNINEPADGVTDEERRVNVARVRHYVEQIRNVVRTIGDQTAAELGSLASQNRPDDKAAWLELFTHALFESEQVVKLALDIKDAVEDRFALLPSGLELSPTGWPTLWSFYSENRDEFLSQIRPFASNHAFQFGRLLTPLVDGIRVKGPFQASIPSLQVSKRRLVLLDGEGLGHKAEAASSVSTSITRRFADVDIIMLVDNAQQPMQAAPIALLRAVGSGGFADKLVVTFSKFDEVKGDNLRSVTQKRNHVAASITNVLSSLRRTLGAAVTADLERRLEERIFFLGGLDREARDIPVGIIREMGRLLDLLQSAAKQEPPLETAASYTPSGLETALLTAVNNFMNPWELRLRMEHWSRVKALSRRFVGGQDHYDTLKPASDLISSLQGEISLWLENPSGWIQQPRNDDERAAAVNRTRKAVYSALHELVKFRLADEHQEDWRVAFNYSGTGSASRRAHEIRRIYEECAPPLSVALTSAARNFLAQVTEIVRTAVVDAGGRFHLEGAA